MNIIEIKEKYPKTYLEFVRWYSSGECEREGYIDKYFTNMFNIQIMRVSYDFFDNKKDYILNINYVFDHSVYEWFWHCNIIYVYDEDNGLEVTKKSKLIYANNFCKTRLAAEIEGFTQLFKLWEKTK